MEELLAVIARGLVENKDAVVVTVDEPDEEGTITYHLHVAQDDMGRVIGRQGKIARAIRTLMRTAANRNGEKVAVTIEKIPSSIFWRGNYKRRRNYEKGIP